MASRRSVSSLPTPGLDPKLKSRVDALTTEFQYYGAAIRNLAPALTKMQDRSRVLPWVNKLFGAEYHVEVLRDKRNRYLAAITVNLINDELLGIFEEDPPTGPTRNMATMSVTNAPYSEWELDTTWKDYMDSLPDEYEEVAFEYRNTSLPNEKSLVKIGLIFVTQFFDHPTDTLHFSQAWRRVRERGYRNERPTRQRESRSSFSFSSLGEFAFLMYQIRPYAALMPCRDARTKVAAWIQTLCRLKCKTCGKMKGLRNDYAYALYGYVHDLRVAGPFQDYPHWKRLKSLPEAAKLAAKRHPLTSPYSEEAENFMCVQPTPEEGAFCYIAVTGDFLNTETLLPP
ncbi:uncharacterized protein LOC105690766 [Athalia rosae]|uniref:uncharacterized protein LOC105690766 n=1 Tax=Athalia rosae TaxID=37344 RepID=UPI002034998B|nr:uncharacterized protein LOC105690766 [Athalia rosae]